MNNVNSHNATERIALAGKVRQLAKEMTEGDPKTAAMLIQAARAIERQPAQQDGPSEGAAVPERVKLPCGCSNTAEGCECRNFDDAMREGRAAGWNECVEAMEKRSRPEAGADDARDAARWRWLRAWPDAKRNYMAGVPWVVRVVTEFGVPTMKPIYEVDLEFVVDRELAKSDATEDDGK